MESPPARVPRDWWLVGLIVLLAIIEGFFNTPLIWRPWHIGITILMSATLLWRRTNPLLMLAISFGVINIMLVVAAVIAEVPEGPYTAAFLLINVYALYRWGSGRDGAIGLVIMFAIFALNLVIDYGGIAETIGGLFVMLFPAELGVMIRYQQKAKDQQINEVRSQEREQIARELHDTVAHHVSAIAIQAQAGRVVANENPKAAIDALIVIEEAAARTLSEMRSMVGSLRGNEDAALAPQPGLREIASLAGDANGLDVRVSSVDGVEMPAPIGAALYRIAQESVTNATRHAHDASRVDVRLERRGDTYRLTIQDDGRQNGAETNPEGYGLVGMAERARLLGGSLEAGPSPSGGWLVHAELPSDGAI